MIAEIIFSYFSSVCQFLFKQHPLLRFILI